MIPAAAPTSAPHRRGGGTRTSTLAEQPAAPSREIGTTLLSYPPTPEQQAAAIQARYRAFKDAARDILDDQPSAGTVRAAARRMTAAIHTMAEEIAEARPC